MDGKKVYQIQINGITESVNAVEALNKQLDALEKRIKTLESSNVKVNTGGGGHSSSLSEEAAVQKEINKLKAEGEKLDAKIVAAQDEVYKKVDATKQLYKETIADQKALAAQERLTADAYSNTMQGMKNHLADLKAVINTTDLGDSDKIQNMTKEANELTNKLKEMEQAYGQFGRNVGNYANGVAEGLSKVKINVGDTVREFDSAKQASRTLGNELKTMAANGQQGTKAFKDLQQAVMELESNINDAKKPMDNLMDSMQSVMAIANVGQGLRGLFGIDDAEMQKSIKNLVALQNILKGIETLNNQIKTREGIGAWIAPFNTQIDKATAKLLTFNTALLGTGKASKVAAVGIKTFSKALKVAFSAGILVAVDLLVEKLLDLVENFKKVDKAAEATKESEEEVAKAYAEGSAKLLKYQTIVKNFNGTKEQEKKLVSELNNELGDSLGTYKSLAEWMNVLMKKGQDYIDLLKLQAKAQASFNLYVKALEDEQKKREMSTEDYANWLNELADFVWVGWGNKLRNQARVEGIQEAKAYREGIEEQWLADQKAVQDFMEKHSVGINAPQATKTTNKKTEKVTKEAQETLNQLVIRLMQDGLNKKLRQLDEEERQTINKLKQNARITNEELKQISAAYNALRLKELDEYLKGIEDRLNESARNIKSIEFGLNTSQINNTIDLLNNLKDKMETLDLSENTFQSLTSRRDLKRDLGIEVDDQLTNSFKNRYDITSRFYDSLIKSLITYQKDVQALTKEDIKEQEKQQKEAESNRYSIQMSGLTKTREEIEKGLKTIEDRYGKVTKEGAIVIKTSNEEILTSYRDLEGKLQEINGQIETAKKQHKDKLLQITVSTNNAIKKNEIDTVKEISSTQEKYYNLQISNYREFLSKLNDEINENPVADKNWGIVNVVQTKKNYNEIVTAAKAALDTIKLEKEKIDKDPFITSEAKEATIKQLEDIENSIRQGMAVTENASKNLIADFVSSTQIYLQAVMDSFSTIMNAVWDAQDIAFDKEQERLDKENELLEEKLNKQQEIIEKHKSAIESIEGELATSRGDRRQHLIDQLNAEIEARRAAAAEEKRIQKEKEANEKRLDALEKKRKKAQYHRDLLQAIVNGAMAVTYASMNTYPIPAIPLMALAASTTAAQVAIMAANKPYAKGGLLEGPSHKQGGIPVGNTGIEVEGKEYVIRKRSTAPNIDVLDYINRSERKLDLGDFIDFYSRKVRKNISASSPRSKFADGGALPTLSNDYSFDDRLLSAFEDYSKRPVVVSVVDINNRQNAVKNVQVLAGLTD